MKKIIKLVVFIVIIALVAVGVVKGKNYYDNRYVGTYYYALVPENQSTEVDDILDSDGKPITKGKDYALKSYDEKEERVLEFDVIGNKPEDLLQPGTFLKIEASKTLVLGEKIINRDEVPKNILKKIEANI